MTNLTTKHSSSHTLREKQHLAVCSRADHPQSLMDLVREKFPKHVPQCCYPASNCLYDGQISFHAFFALHYCSWVLAARWWFLVQVGCMSLQNFWFCTETSCVRQEEALQFNFSVSHCLLYNTAFICYVVYEEACYEKKEKSYLSAQKNRVVLFTPKVTRHGFYFSSLLYEEGRRLYDYTRPSGLKLFWLPVVCHCDAGCSNKSQPSGLIQSPFDSFRSTSSVRCECWLTHPLHSLYSSKPWEWHFPDGPVSAGGRLHSVCMEEKT